ncbi:hypothetical protein V8F33_009786 [Rhypophila sp. PSN 637]
MSETHRAVAPQPDDVVAADRPTMTSETPNDAVPAEGNFIAGTRDENPIWLQRRRRNAAESPLYRLGDELMLDIIDTTDLLDRHVLWFTSARFMRLISTLTMPVPPWILWYPQRRGNRQTSQEEGYAKLRKGIDVLNSANRRWLREDSDSDDYECLSCPLPDSISGLPLHEQNILITLLVGNFHNSAERRSRRAAFWLEIGRNMDGFGDTVWTRPSVALLLEILERVEEDSNRGWRPSTTAIHSAHFEEKKSQVGRHLAGFEGRRKLTRLLEQHKLALRTLLHRDRAHQYCDRCKNGRQHTPEIMGSGNGAIKLEYWCGYCKSSHPSPCYRKAKMRLGPRTAGVLAYCCYDCWRYTWELTSRGRHGKRPCFDCEPYRGNSCFALRVTTTCKSRLTHETSGVLGISVGELSTEWFCLVDKAKVNICSHRALTLREVIGYLDRGKAAFDKNKTKRHALDLSRWLGPAGCGCNSSSRGDLCLSESDQRMVRAVFSNDFSKLRIASRTKVFDLDVWRRREGKVSLDLIRNWTLDKANEDKMRGVLCPHVRLGDGRLLLPFEQNHCACCDYGGRDAEGNSNIFGAVAEGHLSTALHLHDKTEPCCRCRSQKAIGCHAANKSINKPHAEDIFEGNFAFLYPSTGHDYTCHMCQMVYSWTRGPNGPIYLQTSVLIDIDSATRALKLWPDRLLEQAARQWTKHADPESCFDNADSDAEPSSEKEHADFYICPDATCLAGKGRWDWIHFYLDSAKSEQTPSKPNVDEDGWTTVTARRKGRRRGRPPMS